MGMLRAITIFGALLSAAGDDPGRKTPVPAMKPTTAYRPRAEDRHEEVTLAYAYGDWLVWTIMDQVDFRTRAPRFRLRYFRQNLYQPATTQVFEMERTHVAKKVVSVLEDGTVLLDQYRELAWIDREGKVSEEYLQVEGNASKIVQGFPDGVLVQVVQRPARIGHVYFAPLAKRKIDVKAKIRLTDGEGRPAGLLSAPLPSLRRRDRLELAPVRFEIAEPSQARSGRGHETVERRRADGL